MSLPPPLPPTSERNYWIAQCAVWYGYAALLTVTTAFLKRFAVGLTIVPPDLTAALPEWPRAGVEMFLLCTGMIGLTHGLRHYMTRRRWDLLRPGALALRVLVAGFVLSPFVGVPQSFMATSAFLQPMPGTPRWVDFLQHAINWAPLFWVWATIYFMLLSRRKRRYAELRESQLAGELQAAELRALKSQLNPHFLFNSLNSVRALISENPARAQDAVTQLARTLRYSLGSSDQLVTLDQELQMVDDYLALESLRLGERLRIERRISDQARAVRLPVMLLQTVVENAIKHGVAELPEGGALGIEARVADGALRLQVDNPRPATSASAGEGVGLRNSAERLRLLFGDAARIELDLSAPQRAIARICIPVRR